MSSEPSSSSSSSSVPRWLKSLPLAPEYRPSDTDFDDPIAFISRIEREASLFGICKIIPPSPSSSSNSSLSNLSRSLAPSFTTRHQELGLHRKNPSPKQQVWQSGLSYTLDSFHSKSKLFSRAQLHPHHPNHPHPPLLLETLFWNAAASDKPIWVEYANDVPGSGFSPHRNNNRYNPNPNHNPSRRRRRRSGSLDPGGGAAAAATLSDSKWNLQVIARAPGSLTRFMPDDIPGVTSPMVYVAMLFSWFAWHVEDHELHSLNFLHVGAPKTWYAVPGDHAGEFEEVVRVKGYGGNVGRLEAFAMLGEKTTLLSPEVVVASRIPCCRLVQNPGEFVVTFPRAYHIGFSHGFNCGEAANFATPQWLKVAKEAAVRRAAMNYLPMLSHQQLLYILTMSFVSRVPRALFSGVRSSRLKDRRREEREILVKKAFLNDMMAENNLLCVLLSKQSTSNAVLWEPDLLLSPPTVSQSRSSLTLEAQMSGNNVDDHGRENKDDCAMENLTVSARDLPCQIVASIEAPKNACYLYSPTFDEELVEDLDADEDDLPVGLKIDSGTLPCVACGILGYPFMAVVQPSELAHKELFHVNCEQSHQNLGNSSCLSLPSFLPSSGCKFKSEENGRNLREQANPDSSRELSTECVGHVPVSEGRGSRDGTELPNSDVQLPNLLDVKTSKSEHGFCRPRIFCLQHALEIEELLQCKGGANVLIICHSDYIKIKAYTTSVAEEVGMQFNFKDIPLENASPCDLDLINISISDEGHDEHDEDWTSKLGMNLRYSVKPRNQSVSKQEKLSVILCRMFSDNFPPAFSTLKWQSKRSRTPYKVVGVSLSKSYIDVNIEKRESVVRNTNTDSTVKLQVYQSRKRKANAMAIKYFGHLGEGIPDSIDCRNDADCRENHLNKQVDDKNSYELFSVPISAAEDLQMYQDSCEPLGVSNLDKVVDPCRSETCSPNVNVPVLERSEMQNFSAEEYGTWSNVGTSGKSECQAKIVEPEDKNSEVQHETGVVVEINSGYEFENTSCSESEIIQHTSPSGERNLEGSLCNSLLPVNQPCDNSDVQPEVFAAVFATGKPYSSVDHSSKVEERFAVEEFGTKSKFDTATSEKSESQGYLSKSEAKVPEVQLGARATGDANSSQHEGHNSPDSSCVSKKIQNIPISQEPDLVGILENSYQPSAPVLSYDDKNLEIQLEVVNAETHNKGVNVEQSSKLEGQNVSNWSTVDKCELQKVEPPTPEENGGDGNSQLNSRSGTTSSQRQLENLPTDERADVTHGIPVVDNSSMISAVIVPISVLDKTEIKKADGLKRCHRNMNPVDVITYVRRRYKRKLEEEQVAVAHHSCSSFIRGPCEGLRPRSGRIAAPESADRKTMEKKATPARIKRLGKERDKKSYVCDMEGCRMGFRTREELQLHLENLCTHKGCRKQFKSHKHLIQHQRVHLDERPLKCPWKMCEKSFKWAWARTEHIRLHTGERPYKCRVAGCGETFRFVSDFSRHRRKTGHSVNSTDL